MEIFYLGQACFKIKTKEVTLIIDPFDPKFEADIVCVTKDAAGHNFLEGIRAPKEGKEPFLISGPGEYEVKGVTIFGIPALAGPLNRRAGGKEEREPMTLYSLEIEDFTLAHLGSIGQKLSDSQVSELEGVDVLMLPVGGVTVISPRWAVEIVEQVAPSIVIPMLYSDTAPVEKFFEEIEIEVPEPVEKLKLKTRNDLPEEREVVKLKVQS